MNANFIKAKKTFETSMLKFKIAVKENKKDINKEMTKTIMKVFSKDFDYMQFSLIKGGNG